jgi:hypothetical protein
VTRLIEINNRFSVDGNSKKLAREYRNYGKSQLMEMLYLADDQLDKVEPDMTVVQIRKLGKDETGAKKVSTSKLLQAANPENTAFADAKTVEKNEPAPAPDPRPDDDALPGQHDINDYLDNGVGSQEVGKARAKPASKSKISAIASSIDEESRMRGLKRFLVEHLPYYTENAQKWQKNGNNEAYYMWTAVLELVQREVDMLEAKNNC